MTVTENVSPALKNMEKELAQVSKKLFKIVTHVQKDILNRTIQGKDYKGSSFTPYSSSTKKMRRKAGKSTGRVTLSFKGDMLRSMKTKKDGKGVRICFNSPTQESKASRHQNGSGRLPKRVFFELSKKNENYIYKKLREPIERTM